MTEDTAFTEYERTILANVEDRGCHITYVFDDGNDEFVPFCYSVGFPLTVGQGEVISFGLPMGVMKFMINQTLRQCREGLVLEDGLPISGLLEDFDIIARRVSRGHIEPEFFNSAMWFHRTKFGTHLDTAYQLVWPGVRDGLFPWEEGCAERVIELQPPLYEARSLH